MQEEWLPSHPHITVVATLLWNLALIGFLANACLLCKYLKRPWNSILPLPPPSLVIAQCVVNLVVVVALLLATLTLSVDLEDVGVTLGRVSLVMSVGGMLYSWFSQVIMTLYGIWGQHQPETTRAAQGMAHRGTLTWRHDVVRAELGGGGPPNSGRRPWTQRRNNPKPDEQAQWAAAAGRREVAVGASVVDGGSSSLLASSDVIETGDRRREGPHRGHAARRSPAAAAAAAERTEIPGGFGSEELLRPTRCQKQAGSWLLVRCFVLSLIAAFALHLTVPPTRLLCHTLDPFQPAYTFLKEEADEVTAEAAKAEISSKTPFMLMLIGSYLVGFLVNLYSLLWWCCQKLVSISSASRGENVRERLEPTVGEDRVRELKTVAFRPAILAVLHFRWPRISLENQLSAGQRCNKSNHDKMPQQTTDRLQSGRDSAIFENTRNSEKNETDEQISENGNNTSIKGFEKQAESAKERKVSFQEQDVVDVPYIDDEDICGPVDLLPLDGSMINESKLKFDSSIDLDFFETDEYLMHFNDVPLELDFHKEDPILDRPIEYPADEWPLDGELCQVIADRQCKTLDGRESSISVKKKQKTTQTASSQFPQGHADDIEIAAQCGDHVTNHKEEAEGDDLILNQSSSALPCASAWIESGEKEDETPTRTSLEIPPPVRSHPQGRERPSRNTWARWSRLTLHRHPRLSESADHTRAPTGDSKDIQRLAESKRATSESAAPVGDDNNSSRSGARPLCVLKAGVHVPLELSASDGFNYAEGVKTTHHMGQTLPAKPSGHLRLFPLGYPNQSVGHLIPNLRCHLRPRKGAHSAANRLEKRWPRSIDVALLHAEFPTVAEELEEVIRQFYGEGITKGQRETTLWKSEKPSSTTQTDSSTQAYSHEKFEPLALHRCSRSQYGFEHICRGNAELAGSKNKQPETSRFGTCAENAGLKTDDPSRLGNSPPGCFIASQRQQVMLNPAEDDRPVVTQPIADRQPSADVGYPHSSPTPAQQPRRGSIVPDLRGEAVGAGGNGGRGDAGGAGSVAAGSAYPTGPPSSRRSPRRRPETSYQCKCWLGLLLHLAACLPFCLSLLPGVWQDQNCPARLFQMQAARVIFFLHVVVNPLWLVTFHGRQLFRSHLHRVER